MKLMLDATARLANGGMLDPGYFLMKEIAPVVAAALARLFDADPGPFFAASYKRNLIVPTPNEPGAYNAVAAGHFLRTGCPQIDNGATEPLVVADHLVARTTEVMRLRLKHTLLFSCVITPKSGRLDVLIGALLDEEDMHQQAQSSLHHVRMDPYDWGVGFGRQAGGMQSALDRWPGNVGGKRLIAFTRAAHGAGAALTENPCAPSVSRRFPCADAPRGAVTVGDEFRPQFHFDHDHPLIKGLTGAARFEIIERYQAANDPQSLADKARLRAREAAALA